jgi:hypothetical protein
MTTERSDAHPHPEHKAMTKLIALFGARLPMSDRRGDHRIVFARFVDGVARRIVERATA